MQRYLFYIYKGSFGAKKCRDDCSRIRQFFYLYYTICVFLKIEYSFLLEHIFCQVFLTNNKYKTISLIHYMSTRILDLEQKKNVHQIQAQIQVEKKQGKYKFLFSLLVHIFFLTQEFIWRVLCVYSFLGAAILK